ncbi:hypothetical protein DFJ73DRAFT_762704 [Zopfochytrium polystomum]|nr:hypothetical protein DFJ73DRAFT_762704 [Zopfochytrium polystomum]
MATGSPAAPASVSGPLHNSTVSNQSYSSTFASPQLPHLLQESAPVAPSHFSKMSSAFLSLEMAVGDSPFFRAGLNQFEDEVEDMARWTDLVVKAVKNYNENLIKFNEATLGIISKLRSYRKLATLIDTTVVNTFADSLQTICTFKAKLSEDLQEQMINPLQKFLRDDIKDIKDARKVNDKMTEKYDLALAKHAAVTKTKDPSAQQEDAFVLYDVRKAYIRTSFDYTYQILRFKNKLEVLFSDKIMGAMYSHVDYFESSSEVFMGLKPSMDALKSRLTEEVISRVRPQETTPSNGPTDVHAGSNGNSARVIGPMSFESNGIYARLIKIEDHPLGASTEKEGYLFKRSPSKPLQQPVWARRYFMIRNGGFSYCVSQSQGKQRGLVLSTNPVSVLLCGIRVDRREERKNCFEIYTANKSFVLQAESEREMNDWIAVFEASKAAQLREMARRNAQPVQQVGNVPTLSSDPSTVPPPSLPMSSALETQLQQQNIQADPSNEPSDMDENEEDGVNVPDDEMGDVAEEGVVRRVDVQEIENEAETEKLEKFDGVVVNYPPDSSYGKKNKELHLLLKSVPKTDFVLEGLNSSDPRPTAVSIKYVLPTAINCGLLKDIVLQGKLYITQNRLCFHSNILGFVTMIELVIHFNQVTNITRARNGMISTFTVSTKKATNQFKTFMRDDVRLLASINIVWQNALKTTGRMNAQELFDTIYASSRKNEEKSKRNKGLDTEKEASGDAIASADAANGPVADEGEVNPSDASVEAWSKYIPTPIPTSEVTCGCTDGHLEKREFQVVLPVPAKRLFELLYIQSDENTTFFERYHKSRGEWARTVVADWTEPCPSSFTVGGEAPPESAIAGRQMKWTMPVNNPMVKAKEAIVEDTNYLLKRVDCQLSLFATALISFLNLLVAEFTWLNQETQHPLFHTGIRFRHNFDIALLGSARTASPDKRFGTCKTAFDLIRVLGTGIIKQEAVKGLSKGAQDTLSLLKEECQRIASKEGGIPPASISGGQPGISTDGGVTELGSNSTGDSSASTGPEPSILPFELSKSFWAQWGLLGALIFSLLLNLLRGGTKCAAPQECPVVLPFRRRETSLGRNDCRIEESSIDWASDLKGVGKGLNSIHELSMLSYLTAHYPSAPITSLNETSIIQPWRKTEDHITLPGNLYRSLSARETFERLDSVQHALSDARMEVGRTLRWLEQVERAAVWAGYWNWVSDGAEQGGEGGCGRVGGSVGGCEGLTDLLEELEVISGVIAEA